MPAHTTTDAQNLMDGSDLSLSVDLGSGRVVSGVFTRDPVEALDYDGLAIRVALTNADAAGISQGDTVTINSEVYRVRDLEPGNYFTRVILGGNL